MADDLTWTPSQPQTSLKFTPGPQPKQSEVKFTPFASDGAAAVRSIYPHAQITSGHRTGGAGFAGDDHHMSHGAVDVAPIPGMTFDQFVGGLKKAGHPIIQAINEVEHPSKYSTGPHWHVALGEREQQGLTFTPTPKPIKSDSSGLTFTPHSDTPQPPNRAQRPSSEASGGDPSLLSSLWTGAKNVPHSAIENVKGAYEAVRHPIDTFRGVVKTGAGGIATAMEHLGLHPTGDDKKDEDLFWQAVKPFTSWSNFKQQIREDPVGLALTVAGGETAAMKVGKLGLRGVDAAKLANLSPETRAALRAKRIEDSAVSKRYKDMAKPIMAQHRLDAERATAELRKHQKTIGNLSPEEQRKIAMAADTGNREGIAPEHHGALDTIRDISKRYEKKIRDVYARGGHNLPEFVENYYKHWWHPSTTKAELDEFLKKRQGSASSLKHRSIPTLAEGIEAGLKPRYENPLDTMTHYAHQISGHLVNHDLMNAMRKDGTIGAKWVPKRAIPDGYKKLEGIGTEREGRGISKEIEGEQVHTGNAPPMVLAAKDAAARLYNNRVSKGLTETIGESFGPTGAKVASGIQQGTHKLVSLKLFSAFHPTLIAGKSVASDLGNGLRHLTRAAPVDAIKSLAHMPFAPVATAAQGFRMGKRLLAGEEAMTAIDKLYQKAGGSVRTGSAYSVVDAPSYLDSKLRGTLATDLKRSLAEVKNAPVRGLLKMAGRAIDSWNDTVFKYYVPAIKRGAFERELTTSLKAHPEWGEAERTEEARKVFSSIEGRMGLMTRDNMFWSNIAHDIGRMTFLSPSWQLGNVRVLDHALRETPESIRSLFKGKGITQGPAQAAGIVGSFMLGNAVLQYLYTGQRPQSGQDLLAARTGGTNVKDGTPERVMMPSTVKEYIEYFQDPLGEASNVLNPSLKLLHEGWTNRDWSDTPIVHPKDAPWLPGDHPRAQEMAHYLKGFAAPIPLGENPNAGQSKVGLGSAILGLRPVGKKWANPEGYAREQSYFAGKDMARLRKRERKDDQK